MAAAKIVPAPLPKPLYAYAALIKRDYASKGKPVYYAAVPYVEALHGLRDLSDSYGYDDAEGIVIRLLGNLSTWRGETATRVKAELKAALAWHKLTPAQREAAQELATEQQIGV
jgi:hypothetical protein